MKLLKQVMLITSTTLILACGGGGGSAVEEVTPTLSVTVTGATLEAGAYAVESGSQVTVTCNIACSFSPSALNALYSNVTTSATSWKGSMTASNAGGTVTLLANATGQTAVSTVIKVKPKLSVTVTGAGSAGNTNLYTVGTNTQVTLTCNIACTFTPVVTNASYNLVSSSSTTWVGTLINSTVNGDVTVTANAIGQTAVANKFNLLAPLSNAAIQTIVKSANTSSSSVSFIQSEAFYLSRSLESLSSSGTIVGTNTSLPNSPAVCASGSYTASWNVASATFVTVGDFLEMNYNNCDGYNGKAKFTFTGFPSGGRSGVPLFTNFSYLTSNATTISVASSSLAWTTTSVDLNVFPRSITMTGSLTNSVNTTANNLYSGNHTYSSSAITFTKSYPSSTVESESYKLFSNDGTQSYNVDTVTPKSYTSGSVTTNGVTDVKLGAATLRVSSSGTDSTVTGTNTDGSTVSPITLGSAAYF